MDDFDGSFCNQGIYPLLTALFDQFQAPLPPTTILTTYLESAMANAYDVSTTGMPDSTTTTYNTETFDYNATYFEDFLNTTEPYFETTTTNPATETFEVITFDATTAEASPAGNTQSTTPVYTEPTTTELINRSNFIKENQQPTMLHNNDFKTKNTNLPFPKVLNMKQDAIVSASGQMLRKTDPFPIGETKRIPGQTSVLDNSVILRTTAAQKPVVDKSTFEVEPSGLQLKGKGNNVLPVSPLSPKRKLKQAVATTTQDNVHDFKQVSSPINEKGNMLRESVLTTPVNGHDILNFVHQNGNSGRGRVLRTDTIFNSIRKDSASTLRDLQERKDNADKINVVRPRFIFPAARKPHTSRRTNQQTIRGTVQPRKTSKINREQIRRRITPPRISSSADRSQTVRKINQSPTSREINQGQANRRTNQAQTVRSANQLRISKSVSQLQKNTRLAQEQTSRDVNQMQSTRRTNRLQPDRRINNGQASRSLDRQTMSTKINQQQTSGRINLPQISRGTDQQRINQPQISRKAGQQQVNRRINQPQISRRTDQQQMTRVVTQPNQSKTNRRTTQLQQPRRINNQPQIVNSKQNNRQNSRRNTSIKKTPAVDNVDKRGMTAKQTDKTHKPFQPVSFQVPSEKDTKPVLSFVDFKELGIHVVIPKSK